MKTKVLLGLAALLASATLMMAQTQSPGNAQPAPAKKGPMAKSKAELTAFNAAVANTDPAKLEAAAVDFAQKYPTSELRSMLFQAAMGEYQDANNSAKTLEMARAVLKYEPDNAVTLVTAAQMLAGGTKESDLDKEARYQEAESDAKAALPNIDKISQPSQISPAQFEMLKSQLRSTAYEVLGTVAARRKDYDEAIKDYMAVTVEEKEHPDPAVWLRLSVIQEKDGDYPGSIESAKKAIAASEPGSQVRTLAEQQKSKLDKMDVIK